MLALWLLRRLRSLRACLRTALRRLRKVLKGPALRALRWMETKLYLYE